MKKYYFLLAGITLLSSSLVLAGNRPGAVSVTVGDAYYHFANKRHLDNVAMPNLALAYNFNEKWAIEGTIGLLNTNLNPPAVTREEGEHGFLYTVNGVYRFTPYQHFEPYVTAGLGVLALRPNGNNNQYQGNVNAGLGTQYFVNDWFAFRAEARDLYTTTSGGGNDYLVNVGVSFVFDKDLSVRKS